MREILCDKNIENAFYKLGIPETEYHCFYKMTVSPFYCVYSLTDFAYNTIDGVIDSEWREDWGWWRYADGSNLGIPENCIRINNINVIGWRNDVKRTDYENEYNDLDKDEKNVYQDFEEYYNEWCPNNWNTLLEYFSEEFGCTTEKNICALAIEMAKANDMTMSKLFEALQPINKEQNYEAS